jgi:ethanolaminephosphotransferase
MFGFLCNIVPHVFISVLYGSDLSGQLAPWFYIFIGVAYFAYLVADNTDGKQARRTGTSSPMGMLLDHGMDSVVAVIENFVVQKVIQIGNGYFNIVALLISTTPFYFA